MEVFVTVLVEDILKDEPAKVALTAYFTMVALEDGKTVPVPALRTVNKEEEALFEAGRARYLIYKQKRDLCVSIERFKERIKQSNQETVRYFCQALIAYDELDKNPPELNLEQKQEVHRLRDEVQVLSECMKKAGDMGNETGTEAVWFSLLKKFIDYNESLVEKADRIYGLLTGRYERRVQVGLPPVTTMFHDVMNMLIGGSETIERVNKKLRMAILDGAVVEAETIEEGYWQDLAARIQRWHPTAATDSYIHAMMEISVMAHEIKTATRQGKKMLTEAIAHNHLTGIC